MLERGEDNAFSAAFVIGGSSGVDLEYQYMREWHPEVPCFLVGSTGGTARILSHRELPRTSLEQKFYAELNNSDQYAPLFQRILQELSGIVV